MITTDLLTRYNYDEFIPEKYQPWMRFDESPPVGQIALDFPLWQLEDGNETSLKAIWSTQALTVVEFGSFT